MSKTKRLVLTALFIAIGYVLPFITAQIPQVGRMLLPMHIPILLCGFICGASYAACAGVITPIIRSMTLGMPVMYPSAIGMAIELAAYGYFTGMLYKKLPKKNVYIYVALVSAMIIGRVIWGISRLIMFGVTQTEFTFAMFISGAFTTAIPGIIVQIILIPILIMMFKRAKLI